MKVLLWVVRIYSWLIIAWALSSWFGGFPQPVGGALNWLMSPIWLLFSWAGVGYVNFGAIIVLLLLWWFEEWLKKRVERADKSAAPPSDQA